MNLTLPGAAILWVAVFNTWTAAQDMPSPYSEYYGTVERVIDGDTLVVRLDLWPGLEAIYAVRARGIDAPEVRGAACPDETVLAEEARAQAEKLYGPGTTVRIENVELDSFGRAVADIRRFRSDRWLYFAEEMVDRGLAEPWQDDWPEIDWCSRQVEP
jgi:micrococcal nuclease